MIQILINIEFSLDSQNPKTTSSISVDCRETKSSRSDDNKQYQTARQFRRKEACKVCI